ncbi:MAG: MarC family protein [Vulcanimicrobiota bacterium]
MKFEMLIVFLIMLNPFALFLYLKGVMDELTSHDFYIVLLKASLISYGVFLLFGLFGYQIFQKFFQITFESFRIFGGIIIFAYAFKFIMQGSKTFIQVKEDLEDLSSEIALPFMVGAGTISISVLIGYRNNFFMTAFNIGLILLINYLIIVGLKVLKDTLDKNVLRKAFDKYSNIFVRLNGFLAGAIGVDMVLKGILTMFK